MDLRRVTGYVALALVAGYWLWVLSRTAPEMRPGTRGRGLRLRILLVKTAALMLTALVVCTVHFWATAVWHVLVTVPLAAAAGYGLRRTYRRLVAAPRHRLPLGQRVRRHGHLQVIAQPRRHVPAHRHALPLLPAPRRPVEQARPAAPPAVAPAIPEQAAPTP